MGHIPLSSVIVSPAIFISAELTVSAISSTVFTNFPILPFAKYLTILPFLITTTAYLFTIIYFSTFRVKYGWKMHIQWFFIVTPFSKKAPEFYNNPLGVRKIEVQLYMLLMTTVVILVNSDIGIPFLRISNLGAQSLP